MNKKNHPLGLLLLYCAVAGADPAEAEKMQLAEQKSRLVESLIKASSINQEEVATGAVGNRQLLDQARTAMSNARPDEALEKLDAALRSLSQTSSIGRGDKNTATSQKRQFDEHLIQIESFRRSLQEIATTPQTSNAVRPLIKQIDSLTEEGQRLAANGRLEDGAQRMAAAYKLAVEGIARLRQGQEVVISLHFDSPLEEFAYEQKRFRSNEMLLGLMRKETQFGPELQRQIEVQVNAAVDLKNRAISQAGANDYPAAIQEMEKAISQQNRALQLMGIPIF